MFRQEFLADARLVVETAKGRFRRDLGKVAVAFFVFRQHQQMIVGVAFGGCAFDVVIVLLADVKLAADDRLDSCRFGRIHKVHRAENVAMIGHGHGGHAQFFHALDKLFHVAGAIQHGVIGMEVQVNELGHGRSVLILRCRYSNGKS